MASPTSTAPAPTSSRLDWLLFVLLGFFWGSSYLFIKIGLEAGLQPFTLVCLRLLFGLLLLGSVVAIAREPLPREPRMLGHLVVLGLFSVALPFGLITWAEESVDSSLAAVLTGAVPLFVIPFAALLLPAERITVNAVAGIAIGLVGVAIVVGFDPASLAGNELRRDRPHRRRRVVRHRRCLRAAQRPRPAADDSRPSSRLDSRW